MTGGSGEIEVTNHCGVLDWMDSHCGLDLLGCDENCSKPIPAAPQTPPPRRNLLLTIDYAKLHDELLESLLYEQKMNGDRLDKRRTSSSLNMEDSSTNSSLTDTKSRKRRRPLRSSRIAADGNNRTRVSLDHIQPHPPPTQYLHVQCRLQKDKGKGEDPGSHICAKGRNACLEKLREKMALLGQHAASISRKPAKISARHLNLVETRSLLHMRLGFLTMQYGLLVRWDTGHTGKAALVVLRKQCPDEFYPLQSLPPPRILPKRKEQHVVRIASIAGPKSAVLYTLQLVSGTETVSATLLYDESWKTATALSIPTDGNFEVRLVERRRRRYHTRVNMKNPTAAVPVGDLMVTLSTQPPPVESRETTTEVETPWEWLCGSLC